MFGRKEKRALAALPPLHQQLVNDRTLAVSLPADQWAELAFSLRHNAGSLRKRKNQLPPTVDGVVMPLLRLLAEDVDRGVPIGVRLDVRGPQAPGKGHPPVQLQPQAPRVTKVTQTFYVDPWLGVNATLRDGSTIELWVTDVSRVRDIRKRSASGKTKTKSKVKVTQRVRATVVLPKGAVARPPATPPPNWCQVTPKGSGSRPKLVAKASYPIAFPAPAWQLRQILTVLSSCFRWGQPPAAQDRGVGA